METKNIVRAQPQKLLPSLESAQSLSGLQLQAKNSTELSATLKAAPTRQYKLPLHGIFSPAYLQKLPRDYWRPFSANPNDFTNFLLGYKKSGEQGLRAILQDKRTFYKEFQPHSPLAAALFPTFNAKSRHNISRQTQRNFNRNPLLRAAQRKILDYALFSFGMRRFGREIAVHRNIFVDKPKWIRADGAKERLLLLQMIVSLNQLGNKLIALNLAKKAKEILNRAELTEQAECFAKAEQLISAGISANQKPTHLPDNMLVESKTPTKPIKTPSVEHSPPNPVVQPVVKQLPTKASYKSNEDKHANVFINAFRKKLAEKVYFNMFKTGRDYVTWGEFPIGLSDEQKANPRADEGLRHLRKLSRKNINHLRDRTIRKKPLDATEQRLYEQITQTKWHFRHQSDADLSDHQRLQVFSSKLLKRKGIIFCDSTPKEKQRAVAYDDFSFWGVELSDNKQLMPVNPVHDGRTYGRVAFLAPEEEFANKYTYFTLTDHATASTSCLAGNFDDFKNSLGLDHSLTKLWLHHLFYYASARIWVERKPSPMFSFEHMKEAVALAAIYYLRHFASDKLKEFVSKPLVGNELDMFIDMLFQPEMHVPRIFTSKNFIKKRLDDVSLEKLVDIDNINEIVTQAGNNRFMALRALNRAVLMKNHITESKLDQHFHFTALEKQFIQENTKLIDNKLPGDIKMLHGLIAFCPDYKDSNNDYAQTFNEQGLAEIKQMMQKGDDFFNQEDLIHYEKILRIVQRDQPA